MTAVKIPCDILKPGITHKQTALCIPVPMVCKCPPATFLSIVCHLRESKREREREGEGEERERGRGRGEGEREREREREEERGEEEGKGEGKRQGEGERGRGREREKEGEGEDGGKVRQKEEERRGNKINLINTEAEATLLNFLNPAIVLAQYASFIPDSIQFRWL